MKSLIKVGFLGCSHIHAKDYANYLATPQDVQVISVWDNNKNYAENLAKRFHSKVALSAEELCQNEDI